MIYFFIRLVWRLRRDFRSHPSSDEHPSEVSSRRLVEKDVEDTVENETCRHQPGVHRQVSDGLNQAGLEACRRQIIGDVECRHHDEKTFGRPDAGGPAVVYRLMILDDGRLEADGEMMLMHDLQDPHEGNVNNQA